MSFGLEVKNAFGENIIDTTEGYTYYHKSSGSTKKRSSAPTYISSGGSAGYLSVINGEHLLPFGTGVKPFHLQKSYYSTYTTNPVFCWATPSWGYIIGKSGSSQENHSFPKPVSTNKNDIIFFKVPTEGLLSMDSVWFNFTGSDRRGEKVDVGLHGTCCPHPSFNGTVEYKVVSTDLPAPFTDHGLRVFGSNGSDIKFDTSREIASFSDHVFLTAAQQESVIKNGATINITLRKPISNLWMANASGVNSSKRTYYNSSGMTTWLARYRLTSPTNLQVSRVTLRATGVNWATTTLEMYDDVLFILGDY